MVVFSPDINIPCSVAVEMMLFFITDGEVLLLTITGVPIRSENSLLSITTDAFFAKTAMIFVLEADSPSGTGSLPVPLMWQSLTVAALPSIIVKHLDPLPCTVLDATVPSESRILRKAPQPSAWQPLIDSPFML